MEEVAEIVDRLCALGLLADDDVDPEPVQSVFVVEIGAAAPGFPGSRREIKLRGGVGGVLQVAPFAAGSVIESGGGDRQVVAILFGVSRPLRAVSTKPR